MGEGGELFGEVREKGDVIFRQGEPGDTMYVLQSGAAEVLRDGPEGRTVAALLEPGDFFGEMALLDESPRTATVRTIARSRLLRFPRETFLERIRTDPAVVLPVLRALTLRLDRTHELLERKVGENQYFRNLLGRLAAEGTGAESGGGPAPSPEVGSGASPGGEPLRGLPTPHGAGGHTGPPLQPPGAPPVPAPARAEETPAPPKAADEVRIEAGATLFRRGDPGGDLYWISEGEVEIRREDPGGRPRISRAGPGESVGAADLAGQALRDATATALTPVVALRTDRDGFLRRARSDPAWALSLLQASILRLRRATEALADPAALPAIVQRSLPQRLPPRVRVTVALVSLSGCGGCGAALLDDRERLASLLEEAEVGYCPLLMDRGEIRESDVVLVEGIVRGRDDEEKLREARAKARHLVAWGTCSSFMGIPALANRFALEDLIEASFGEARDPFAYYFAGSRGVAAGTYQEAEASLLRRARGIGECVRADWFLPGCPPPLRALEELIRELKGAPPAKGVAKIVCAECRRKIRPGAQPALRVFPGTAADEGICLVSAGIACLGSQVRGGCGAPCPRGGLPCWGCRGPSDAVLRAIGEGESLEEVVLASLARRTKAAEADVRPVLKTLRAQGHTLLSFPLELMIDPARIR